MPSVLALCVLSVCHGNTSIAHLPYRMGPKLVPGRLQCGHNVAQATVFFTKTGLRASGVSIEQQGQRPRPAAGPVSTALGQTRHQIGVGALGRETLTTGEHRHLQDRRVRGVGCRPSSHPGRGRCQRCPDGFGSRRRLRDVVATSLAFRHGTPDFGVLTSGGGYFTLRPMVDAPQSLPLTLGRGAFAFVCPQLPLVGVLLALVRDAVALVGHPLALVSHALPPGQVPLSPREVRFALVSLNSAPTRLARSVGAVPIDHLSTLSPRAGVK